MRKTIIAAIVAAALFAVGAFAANFTTQAEDVASGADSVLACADEVDLKFAPGDWNDADDVYETASVTATFYNAAVGETDRSISTNCDDMEVKILVDLNTAPLEDESGLLAIDGGEATYVGPWSVSDIEGAAVLIEDIVITSTATSPFANSPFAD